MSPLDDDVAVSQGPSRGVFGGSYLLTPELAAVLEMDVTALRRPADAGDRGARREAAPHVLTLDEAVGFLQKMSRGPLSLDKRGGAGSSASRHHRAGGIALQL